MQSDNTIDTTIPYESALEEPSSTPSWLFPGIGLAVIAFVVIGYLVIRKRKAKPATPAATTENNQSSDPIMTAPLDPSSLPGTPDNNSQAAAPSTQQDTPQKTI